jgi:membrane protein implicated in regulation of membrane protease activity
MRNLILMILVIFLIIIDIVVLIELLNYGRNPITTILFLVASIIIITAIVKTRKRTSQKSLN